jgi:hypothetical protein
MVMSKPIVTIHQPEHFPYLGFFQKMQKADIFVILDNVNFRKNYFQNRNNFLNRQGKLEWFTVPVPKDSPNKIIKEVVPADLPPNWRKMLVNKINLNLKVDTSYIYDSNSLIEINMRTIEWARKRLGITTPIVYASELSAIGSKSLLLLEICKELNASKYISGPSGKDYLELELFREHGISVDFHEAIVPNYYSCLHNLK